MTAMDALKAFRVIGTEFEGVPDEQFSDYSELFSPMVSQEKFGKSYSLALALYVAHKMKLHGLSGDADDSKKNAARNVGVASYSEGDTSISYSDPANSGSTETDAELTLTLYGIEFMRLLRSCIISITI